MIVAMIVRPCKKNVRLDGYNLECSRRLESAYAELWYSPTWASSIYLL